MHIITIQRCALTWARNAGYNYIELEKPANTPQIDTSHEELNTLPISIQVAAKLVKAAEELHPIQIITEDLTAFVWNWYPKSPESAKFKFFFISRANELLCSDPSDNEVWLHSFPCFKRISDHEYALIGQHESIKVDHYPSTVCLSGSHFGHWVADTLPTIVISTRNNRSVPVITRALSTEELNFIGNTLGLIGVNLYELRFKAFQSMKLVFAKTNLIQNVGINSKIQFLRNSLSVDKSMSIYKNEESCYLLRGQVDGQSRIANEDEVIKVLSDFGSRIVNPLDFPFFKSKDFFASFSKFIFYNSSVNTNFNILSNISSKALILLHPAFNSARLDVVLGSSIYLVPTLTRSSFAILNECKSSNHLGAVHVDVHSLRPVIRQFLAL
jgi:hypothetical protein